jgi:uncharacterized membrane protein YbhN (UPF0104 family)
MSAVGSDAPEENVSRRHARLVGWIIGASLLLAAIVVAVRVLPQSVGLLAELERPDPVKLVLLPVLVLVNLLLSTEIFHLLGRRFVAITRLEDLAIVSGLTLANYLPFRPGIFMRISYFKGRHQVPVGSTARVLAEAFGATALSILLVLVLLLVAESSSFGVAWVWIASFIVPGLAALSPGYRLYARVSLLRLLEILFWALRIHLSFALLGEPIDFSVASAVALAGMSTQLIPFVGNGLGLREWATGLLAGLLAGTTLGQALAAELLIRAAELLVILPAGVMGSLWIRNRRPVSVD